MGSAEGLNNKFQFKVDIPKNIETPEIETEETYNAAEDTRVTDALVGNSQNPLSKDFDFSSKLTEVKDPEIKEEGFFNKLSNGVKNLLGTNKSSNTNKTESTKSGTINPDADKFSTESIKEAIKYARENPYMDDKSPAFQKLSPEAQQCVLSYANLAKEQAKC